MRGDLCPYDHGSDPVVLEDVPLPQVLSYQTNNLAPLPPPGNDMLVPQDCIRPPVNLAVPPNNLPAAVMSQIIRPPLIRPQTNSGKFIIFSIFIYVYIYFFNTSYFI